MATKRKGLGRGLEALLTASPIESPIESAIETNASLREAALPSSAPVEALTRGRYQPRVDMRQESLQELAESIRSQGVIQPIVVRALADAAPGNARYEIVAGERRWRAAQLAGLADVPIIVRQVDDETAIAMALIENIQREDLNPLEEAQSLKRLVEDFELTHEEVARAVGRSRAAVSNLIRLTDLGPKIQALLRSRDLEMGHARALLGLRDAGERVALAEEIVRARLSVRETERRVRDGKRTRDVKRPAPQNPDIRRLELELADKLGANVSLKQKSGGKGALVIQYNNHDELDGILAHIK